MKFIQFDDYRINIEVIASYEYRENTLCIDFLGGGRLWIQNDRAADLVKVLDKSIGVAGEEA